MESSDTLIHDFFSTFDPGVGENFEETEENFEENEENFDEKEKAVENETPAAVETVWDPDNDDDINLHSDSDEEDTLDKMKVSVPEMAANLDIDFENLRCNLCKITFVKLNYLELHKKLIHDSYMGKCPVIKCSKCFLLRKELMDHMKIHKITSRFQCRDCSERFLSFQDFLLHEKVHFKPLKKETVMCEHCSKIIIKNHITRHYRNVHKLTPLLQKKRRSIW